MTRIFLNDRQRGIVNALVERERASVEELSSLFNVSSVTIRNDLSQLSKFGHVVRTHGGARIVAERVRQESNFSSRQRLNAQAKTAIGALAARLIKPNESILLDSSSTAVAVAQAIRRMRISFEIHAFVTGIWTALELLGDPNIHVVIPGGNVRNTTGSFTGSLTNEIINRYNFNKVFLGAMGVSVNEGLTDSPMLEVELKQEIIARAQQVISVVDGCKFGKVGLASFAATSQIDQIITDKSAPSEQIDLLREKGVEILIAE